MMPELLAAVRNYLDVTWEDVETDEKLTGIIARGIRYLNSIAGANMDYSTPDNPQALLFDYCRYAWSNALDEFSKNYLAEILFLQITENVKAYETTIV